MNNLKKYTKDELIAKLKSQKENNSKFNENHKFNILIKINTYLSQLWNLMATFKNIIAKLTLISFFIQIFRKYKIFRKLWYILNTIVMSIFGISLIDNFGFEFINNLLNEFKIIFGNTINYLSNTKFYDFLNKLFSNNETESETPSRSIEKTMSGEYSENESKIRENKGNSKISEWLKPENDLKEHIKEDIKTDESNYKKYFIIAGVIISTSLVWYYSDEIKTGGRSLFDWIVSFWDHSSNNGGDDCENNRPFDKSNISKPLNENKVNETKYSSSGYVISEDIELVDRTVDKGKKKIFTSPSIENLSNKVEEAWCDAPNSPTSTSSTETITPKNFNKLFEIKPEESVFSSIVKSDWKEMINSDNIKESINYVESHLPKSELDNTNYLNQLLDDVTKHNTNYAQEIVANKSEYSIEQLKLANNIAEETWNWIDNMKKEIKKFE